MTARGIILSEITEGDPMAEGIAATAEIKVGRLLHRLAAALAIAGGLVLAAFALLTVASIIGRAMIPFGLSAINGDFELVEIGCAIAVFSFLPWCQLQRGHVTVDIFTDHAPADFRRFMELIGNITILLIAAVIAWRIVLGMLEKFSYEETTFILGMPVWYGYALSVIGAIFFLLVSLYTVWHSLNSLLRRDDRL